MSFPPNSLRLLPQRKLSCPGASNPILTYHLAISRVIYGGKQWIREKIVSPCGRLQHIILVYRFLQPFPVNQYKSSYPSTSNTPLDLCDSCPFAAKTFSCPSVVIVDQFKLPQLNFQVFAVLASSSSSLPYIWSTRNTPV